MLHLGHVASLGEALADTIVTHKTNVALIEAERHRENARFTYLELAKWAQRFAHALIELGLAPGDRCAILMQNQSKWLLGATGAFWAGAVLVPLDYKLTPPEQLKLLELSRPKVLLTDGPTFEKLRAVPDAARVLDGLRVVASELPEGAAQHGAIRWETLPTRDGQPKVFVARSREDVACIVYSSGTGGTPKGCMLTHGNYLAQAESLGGLYPMREDERYFSIIPTNHAIDFMCGFILPLLFGGAIVHQRTLRPQFLAPTMKKYGVTHIALVPAILRAMERRIRDRLDELDDWKRRLVDGLIDLNSMLTLRKPRHAVSRNLLRPFHDQFGGRLKLMFCGGAFVDRKLAEFFYDLGFPVVIGYGLTEAGTVLTVNDLKPFRSETVGRPVPFVELRLEGADADGVGEVCVRGPTVMRGYLDQPELTAQTLRDGWLHTGDLGYLDASGHLVLVGRAKNMIVTEGGKNVYPEDIEGAFEDLEGCEELAVFAKTYLWPKTGLGGDEALVVVLRGKDDAVLEDMLDRLRDRNRRLADYKRVKEVVVWDDEFPRTASLKIKRQQLRDDIQQKGVSSRDLGGV